MGGFDHPGIKNHPLTGKLGQAVFSVRCCSELLDKKIIENLLKWCILVYYMAVYPLASVGEQREYQLKGEIYT